MKFKVCRRNCWCYVECCYVDDRESRKIKTCKEVEAVVFLLFV